MNTELSKLLLQLSETDKDTLLLANERGDIRKKLTTETEKLERERKRLVALEADYQTRSERQSREETQLRDEERRIVERRKQLTAGGVKNAKLLERELDVATRTIHNLEQNAINTMEEVEAAGTQVAVQRESLEKLETHVATLRLEQEARLSAIESQVAKLGEEIKSLRGKADPALLRLYDRIRTRYPANPVAVIKESSCQGCYRALPHMTVNQILAGNANVQCPGCHRLLVMLEQDKPKEIDE